MRQRTLGTAVRIRKLERGLFIVPALVLAVSFIGVCVQAGTPWPWNRVVHEDGHRTLLQTIFYFEHATRELLLDVVLAIAVAGAARYFWPPARDADDELLRQARLRMGILTLLTVAAIVGGTAWVNGGRAILDDLAQYPTRDGAPLVWGAHWRYHFVERIADIAVAFALAGRSGSPTVVPAMKPTCPIPGSSRWRSRFSRRPRSSSSRRANLFAIRPSSGTSCGSSLRIRW